MKKFWLTSLFLLGALTLTACGASESKTAENGSDKIKAIATFYPIYEFTKEVIGDDGDVELLIPAGTEPHDYEPSAKDMAKISEMDAFVYSSPDMETWVEQMTDSVDKNKTAVIEAAQNIKLKESNHPHGEDEHQHNEEDHHHNHDPHVWTDPVLAIKEVEAIRDELSEKFPDKKADFEKNAQAYIEKLQALDQEFSDALVDATNKTFVTQHAAFGYLADQYGLTQISIAGITPDQEPSPSRLAELKHFVEDHGIKLIYFEKNASSKVAETLAKETGVKLSVLNPLESLTEEQMKNGETYLTVMQENLKALQESIQ